MPTNDQEPRTKNQERSKHTTRVLYIRVTTEEWLAAHVAAKLSNQSIQSWTRAQLGLPSRRGYQYRSGQSPIDRMSKDDQAKINAQLAAKRHAITESSEESITQGDPEPQVCRLHDRDVPLSGLQQHGPD